MTNGWAGTILRVNLTEGAIEKEPTEKYSREFLGGNGINAKILWDEVAPEVHPLDPENRLVFGAGPLVGTIVPGSCRCSVTSKSPQSGIFGDANFGGYWAPELKFAGYDHIVIYGRSEEPVYMWIEDTHVELRSAGHLWGKDTIETERIIKGELDKRDIQVACIGPAGENKVVSASINHGLGNIAARTGMGAVMGSKNLKAIAVRGSGDVSIAMPSELSELCTKIVTTPNPISQSVRGAGGAPGGGTFGATGLHVYGSHEETLVPEFKDFNRLTRAPFLEKYRMRELACFNCPLPCKGLVSVPDTGGQIVLKCEGILNWLQRLKLADPTVSAKAMLQCHKYGLDMFSTTAQVAFLMDLYEKGIITEKDTDGIPMKWKNDEAMYAMIEKIAKREGCGEIFADGIVKAAEKIGGGVDKYAYHVKGVELPNYSHYRIDSALGAAISERGDQVRTWSSTVAILLHPSKTSSSEATEASIQKYFPPELWETMHDEHGYKGKASLLEYSERVFSNMPDLLGVCKWLAGWMLGAYFQWDEMVKFVSMVTGKDIDVDMLNTYSERKANLTRAFNVREGIARKDDTVNETLFSEPSTVTGQPLDRKKFNEVLDEFYSLHGWDSNGMPTRKRLEELGLKYVADELEEKSYTEVEANSDSPNRRALVEKRQHSA